MSTFKNEAGKPVLMRMVKGIQENKAYLGEVDGLIGDGDHGMNMNKGFSVFEERFKDEDFSFAEGLDELGMILLNEIGGSMGPIYGTIFMDMAEAGEDLDEISDVYREEIRFCSHIEIKEFLKKLLQSRQLNEVMNEGRETA